MTAAGLEATVLTPHGHRAARLAVKPVNVIRSAKQVAHQAQKTSNRLDVPEVATPHQSPQQKQLKMTDLEAQSVMPTPTEDESLPQPGRHLSSQVVHIQIAEQGVLRSAVQYTEVRMEAMDDLLRSLLPLARTQRRSDTGLCPRNPYFRLNQIMTWKQMGDIVSGPSG